MPAESPPHTPGEIERWAHRRRPHEREAVPAAGERLLFRERDFGEPVPAVVHAVQDMTSAADDHWAQAGGQRGTRQPDPNVWEPELDGWNRPTGRHRLKDDPWPWVAIQLVRDGPDGEELAAPRWCKEARVRGSAGWLREGSRAHTGNYESGA